MKKFWFTLTAGLALACTQAGAQEHAETLKRSFTLNPNGQKILALYNTFGAVKVVGHAGDKVEIEATRSIRASDNGQLEQARAEVKLEFEQHGDSISVYLSGPFDSRPNRQRQFNRDERDYRFKVDYIVKVPYQTSLHVSTVNNGDIEVSDVAGGLKIRNVNGEIVVRNARGTTDATTVNGDVQVSYAANPSGASRYHTINGKIEVSYKPDLSADLYFKSMNGSYFTDFDEFEPLHNTVVKNETSKGGATVYRLNKNAGVRIGRGGKTFHFETLNGNIYIKKSL